MSRRLHKSTEYASIDATPQYPHWGKWVRQLSGLRPMRPEREQLATTKAGAIDHDEITSECQDDRNCQEPMM